MLMKQLSFYQPLQCGEKFNIVLESHFAFPVIETEIVTSSQDNILREIAMANIFRNKKLIYS